MDLSKIKYIISDWDGTLSDGMPLHADSFSKVLAKRYGLDLETSKRFYLDKAGTPLGLQFQEAVKLFVGKDIKDPIELEEMFYENLKGKKPNELLGAREFLEELNKQGFTVIVWSGTKQEVVEERIRLHSFSKLIDFVICDVSGSKTLVKGLGLFKIISNHFNLSPTELALHSLVFGDGIGDIEAGKQIGAITVGFGDPKDPKFKNADFVVQSHQELLDMLNSRTEGNKPKKLTCEVSF